MKYLFLYFIIQINGVSLFCQPSNFSVFDSAITKFDRNNPQEKVFVQTDKQYYYAGETIWMKAWCTLNNQPTYLSRILYIDLTNSFGEVVMKKMYKLDSLSSTPADFQLPQALATGTYSLNSYTLWMKNFPKSTFSKNIVIYGVQADSLRGRNSNPAKPILQFFPEGGNLVTGISNRVAFKATNSNNLPENVEGYISDNTDKKVVDIVSLHDGMGMVEFVPQAGKMYSAYIKQNSLVSYTYPLPVSQPTGVSLKVENSNPNKLFVMVNRGVEGPATAIAVAQINNIIIMKAKLDLSKGESAIAINKKDLPGGIIQITIFDQNNRPLAERIAFIENYKLESPAINFQNINSGKKGLNSFNIVLPEPQKAQSVSCLVTSYVPGQNADSSNIENIISALFLTSDVKGYVHNSGYYFKDKSKGTLKNLDLLLMTQGWRKFEWQKILDNKLPVIKYPVETSIVYKGRVFKAGGYTRPIEEGFVSFVLGKKSKNEILAEAKVDSKGNFVLSDLNFYDTTSLSYMGTNSKRQKLIANVKMQPNYIDSLLYSQAKPEAVLHKGFADNKDLFAAQWLRDDGLHAKILETVVVKGRRTKDDILNDKYATGYFKDRPGIIIDPTDFRKGKPVWDMLNVSVAGLKVERTSNFFEPILRYGRSRLPIQYSINQEVVDSTWVYQIDEEQIAMVKFFDNVVFDDPFDMNPVPRPHIAIYTKDRNRPFIAVHEKRYFTDNVFGYALTKKFYEPDYQNNPQSAREEDNRFTLYWNPDIQIASDGKYNFNFYNNDFGKKYVVVIQGLTKNGKIIYKWQIVE